MLMAPDVQITNQKVVKERLAHSQTEMELSLCTLPSISIFQHVLVQNAEDLKCS